MTLDEDRDVFPKYICDPCKLVNPFQASSFLTLKEVPAWAGWALSALTFCDSASQKLLCGTYSLEYDSQESRIQGRGSEVRTMHAENRWGNVIWSGKQALLAEMMSKKKWLRDEELSEGRLQEGLEFEACVGNLDFFGSQPRTWHLVMTQAASE